jgi:hypothetical protein
LSGPSNFGSGGPATASSGTGDLFGVTVNLRELNLILPTGYSSGSTLSGTSTYAGSTFASLGMTPGTYVWTWGSGANADSFTLRIVSAAAVPEPSTLASGLVAVCALGVWQTWRRRVA